MKPGEVQRTFRCCDFLKHHWWVVIGESDKVFNIRRPCNNVFHSKKVTFIFCFRNGETATAHMFSYKGSISGITQGYSIHISDGGSALSLVVGYSIQPVKSHPRPRNLVTRKPLQPEYESTKYYDQVVKGNSQI